MLAAISTILKSKIANLTWVERFGGLVTIASRPTFVAGDGNVQIHTGYEQWPVSCDVNAAQCWEGGKYKHFMPQSSVSAIAFFVDDGGVRLRKVDGPKNAGLEFAFSLKFLMWMNLGRLGITDCNFSSKAVPFAISQLFGQHASAGVFSGGIQEQLYPYIDVASISELPKTPSMFSPFSFATDPDRQGIFLFPYDYFGLSISGTFIVNTMCLPELFAEDFEFIDPTCLPV